MLVTLLGIVMPVRPEQPSNAELPMLVTLSPKMTSSIDDFPLNQEPTVVQFNSTFLRPEQL